MSGSASHPDWEEIEHALATFLELPEEQQAGYLAQQPPAVRAEVESLLAAYRRSANFLGDETGKPIANVGLLGRMRAMLGAAGSEVLATGMRLDPNRIDAGVRKAIAIKPGTQIGPYRIEAEIGEGGMGVVYRALDTNLNRLVAIKFLFDELADATARRRFQREAQTASSLNHPHILTVHDAGDFEDRQYLVTEFVDGGTLKDWARAEKRTWREIVALLVGVADGLATAHAAGIMHRDIKPDNILVGRNGYAKLADFGLAKLQESVTPEGVTQTLASKHTRPGIILGTIAYMSPEQASGRPTDARSDIFSFGIVLYELLAGRRPFEGATDLELLQTIIHGAARPLVAEVPSALRTVVEKALEHAPAERYQSTRDLVVDLRRLTRQSGELVGLPAPPSLAAGRAPSRHSWKYSALAVLSILAVLLAGGVLLLWLQRPAPQAPRRVVQFDIFPPQGTIFAPPVGRQSLAISPDGRRLAFTATGANGTNIWLRDLASPDMRAVPGTEGAWSVFWPPDSRSVFFSVNLILKQANLETGSGRSVATLAAHAQIGAWRPNGDVLLYLGRNDNYELRVEDGRLKKLTDDGGMRWPEFLPGGDRFVYVAYDPVLHGNRAMAAEYLSHKKPVALMEVDSRVQYAPPRHPGEPGYLLFMRGAGLLAQPFDAERLRLAGEPFPIAQNVVYYGPTFSASFSVSTNGVLVYQAGYPASEMKTYDRRGNDLGTAGQPALHWGNVRISRDGRRVAAAVWSSETGGAGVWIFDANGRESRRLTFPPEVHRRPVWSPDGMHVAIGRSQNVGDGPRLATLDLSSGAAQFVDDQGLAKRGAALPTDWSWDGRFIAFDDGVGDEVAGVWIADVPSRKIAPLLQSKFQQWGAAFSPDGKRIAFVSVESGRAEVYVQAFDSTPSPHVAGEKRQVSRGGAWLVRWRADGRELFYVGRDNSLYAVPARGTLEFGEPKALFRIAGAPQYGTTRDFQFDVAPDGQRFIMPTTGSVPPPPFTVIENWQDKFHL